MSANDSPSGDHLYQAPHQKPAVISDVPARQGVTGHNVRYVLFFGLGGAIVAMAIVFVIYFH